MKVIVPFIFELANDTTETKRINLFREVHPNQNFQMLEMGEEMHTISLIRIQFQNRPLKFFRGVAPVVEEKIIEVGDNEGGFLQFSPYANQGANEFAGKIAYCECNLSNITKGRSNLYAMVQPGDKYQLYLYPQQK